jgi:hypothetical protein
MPKLRTGASLLGQPITIRLPADEEAFYRQQAARHRMPLSGFLAKMLVQGVIAENLLDVEERIGRLVASIPAELPTRSAVVSDDLALSLFTCEALLTAIVQAQDYRTLYAAQDAAKAHLKKRQAGWPGRTGAQEQGG